MIMVKAKVLACTLFAVYLHDVTCFQQCSTKSMAARKIIQHKPFGFLNKHLMVTNDDLETDNSNKGLSRSGVSSKITEVQKLDDFLGFIAEDERLCVVKFYASWCKSCHKFGIKYKKLAMKHGDMLDKNNQISDSGEVRFAEVEYGKNTSLCRSLGIRKLPYVIIHKASVGKIAEFSCGPKYFDERLVSRLNRYLGMSDEELQFEQKMEAGDNLGNDILSQLQTDDVNQPSI